jgi:hypothetical protein
VLGVSRSATIVIHYLVKEGMSLREAFTLVKERRPAIAPNVGFFKKLVDAEKGEALVRIILEVAATFFLWSTSLESCRLLRFRLAG